MKILISVISLVAIILHIVFPNIKIDGVSISLFILALLPWLSYLLEEFEMPGGWKFKYKKTENLEKRFKDVGLNPVLTEEEEERYSFEVIATDMNLSLAGLRIEIEKRLKRLAEMNDIGTKNQGLGRLLQMLSDKELIGLREESVLKDMTSLLNNAVHGQKVDKKAFDWAMEYGIPILKALDRKIAVSDNNMKNKNTANN